MVYNVINGVFLKIIMVLWIFNRIKSYGCLYVFVVECLFDLEFFDKNGSLNWIIVLMNLMKRICLFLFVWFFRDV